MTLPVRKIQDVEKYARKKHTEVVAMLRRVGTFDELKRQGLIDDIPSSHSQTSGEAEPAPGPDQSHEISGPTVSVDDRQDELNCPPELKSFLDQTFTVKEIAYMVFRKPKSIKLHHKQKWKSPDIKSAGNKGAEWTLRKVLPALIKDFVSIRPPQNPGRLDVD